MAKPLPINLDAASYHTCQSIYWCAALPAEMRTYCLYRLGLLPGADREALYAAIPSAWRWA